MINISDTIVAISTAAGPAAIAVVRLSGANAINIASSIFSAGSKDLSSKSHVVHHGWIKDGEELVDEVLLSVFLSPNTYTGEDVIEISCHGSPYIQNRILQLCLSKRCRMAEPGEFTQRAFLNGKLDLIQAEAVADLIASASKASHERALKQMRGNISKSIKDLRQQLMHFASLIELELDFSEEDVEFANRKQLALLLQQVKTVVRRLMDSFKMGNAIKDGIPVTIAGKPNVGKSTLLNALLDDERAIVSEIPGTTRDTVEDSIQLGGYLFRFSDTAGIRETTDTIEAIGVGKTMKSIGSASLLLYVFDPGDETLESVRQRISELDLNDDVMVMYVANKSDLYDEAEIKKTYAELNNLIIISASTGQNIVNCQLSIVNCIKNHPSLMEDSVITSLRHYDALQKTYNDLEAVQKGMDNNISADLLAVDLRSALNNLGSITGEITSDDLLGMIFSEFCIGK